MSKRFLLSLLIVLLITNITTLLFWMNAKQQTGETVVVDESNEEIERDEPVATIGNEEIMVDQWMKALRDNYGEQQLKQMIDKSIVKQLATEKGITVHDKVLEREIALLTSTQGVMTKNEVEKVEKQWTEDITFRYQLEALLTEGISIPEEEIKTYYNLYKNQYNFPKSLQLSHILVNDRETAEKVVEELNNGASFSLLAKEYSIDEESKDEGGYIGYFTTTTQFLPANYDVQAEKIEEFSYSEPFVTDRGFAIIFLHRSLPKITFSYEELRPYIKNELALDELGQSLSTNPLWEKFDINWLYDE
ncbi:peptidylprolyl isomerase [Ornithinibacillus halophilus]|uniref:peptidylprolyl isomerase n=1 Tax=Ornithinibacillus halophilus TaxID=930117 RepID=A0A1M5JJ69_9BACI|nr:peptidylprolyl isomerase [Ornithinibacillus halophilus]SHG40320.1 foldase protein PrsA [Ornithinibacillus halophilus]